MRHRTFVLILTTLLVGCDKKDPEPPMAPSAAPPTVATAQAAATVAPEAPAAAEPAPSSSAAAEGHLHHGPGHEGKPGEHRRHPE
jgi:hypothetical protein